jgi:hypothetical protein
MWDVPVSLCLDLIQQLEPQGRSLHVTTDIRLQKPATQGSETLAEDVTS